MNVKKKQHVLPRNNVKTETKTGIHQVKEKRKEKRKAWTRQYSCKQIDPAHCFYGNVSSGKSGDKKKKKDDE